MHYSFRLLVIAALVIGLGKLIWEALNGTPFRAAVGAGLVVAIGVLGFMEYRAQAAEARLGAVASEIAHRDVAVRCQGLLGSFTDIGSHLGYVQFDARGNPADVTHISRDACGWLKNYAGGDHAVTLENALGVHTLAHEALHLQGTINEAKAECYGLQQMPRTAELLGADPVEAHRLAVFAWDVIYPSLPREYQSPNCGPGLAWDLDASTPAWP